MRIYKLALKYTAFVITGLLILENIQLFIGFFATTMLLALPVALVMYLYELISKKEIE